MKYSPFVWIYAALSVLGILACNKENTPDTPNAEKTDFPITFRAEYDGQQIVKYVDYPLDTFSVEFLRHYVFLSDITLIQADGSEVLASEIEYVDFFPDTATTDLSKTPKYTFNVPEGDYKGIKMSFGVKQSLNSQKPGNFPAGHPLANDLEYWAGWKSYIFMKIDGGADAEKDNLMETGLVYHCGSDAVYKTMTFNKDFHVHANGKGLTVVFDLKEILTWENGRPYNVFVDNATSNSRDSMRVADDLMSRYNRATTLIEN